MAAESQDATATAEATADNAESQESQAKSEAGEGKETPAKEEKQEETKQEESKGKEREASASFAIPEGFTMTEEQQTDLTQFFGDLESITDPKAREQKLVDKHFEMLEKVKAQGETFQKEQQAEWLTEAKADDEIGGTAMKEKVSIAIRAINKFSDPAMDEDGKPILNEVTKKPMTKLNLYLNETGLGNHPEMIRVFYRIGQAISEDGTFIEGKVPGAEKPDIKTHLGQAKTLFPEQGKEKKK